MDGVLVNFDGLHDKFLKCWGATVKGNEWQANTVHLVLLSQLFGTSPSTNTFAPRDYSGMRVQLNGGWVHPRLHMFLCQPSGTGKGEGQKALQNLVRYFNVRLFAQRHGVTDIDTGLWEAYEKYRRVVQEAKWQQAQEKKAEELETEAETEAEDDAEEPSEEDAKKPRKKKPYTMTSIQKRDFMRDIQNHDGQFWRFFTSNTANVYPMTIMAAKTTVQRLVGGYEITPDSNGIMHRVWKPGAFETQSFYAWDEARNILFAKDQEGITLNAALCTALDNQGFASTGARKDIDEDGNAKEIVTYTSVLTGTTEVAGLDQSLAEGGLLQRFIIGYHRFDPEELLRLRKEVARGNTTPPELWSYLKEYYDEFVSLPAYRGNITCSPAAFDYQDSKIDAEEEFTREMFGAGSSQYRLASTFLNRRNGMFMKAAAILAALDGDNVIDEPHIKRAFDLIGDDSFQSIQMIIDDCSSGRLAGSEAKDAQCDAILLKKMTDQLATSGRSYVYHDDLVELARFASGWPRKGYAAASQYIKHWAVVQSSFILKSSDPQDGKIRYSLRNQSLEKDLLSRREGELAMNQILKESGKASGAEDWVGALRNAKANTPVLPEPEDLSRADQIDTSLQEFLAKKAKEKKPKA